MARWGVAILMLLVCGAARSGVVAAIHEHVHLGVASCASSVCHGASQPFEGSNVLQNEYAIWLEYDPHARAYQTLRSEASQRIARNLGLRDAQSADVCLDCHATNVPLDRRGERFRIEDGVGCEACHGGAEPWIASHAAPGTAHADNLARGLYPTSDPVARAKLCLSCHMGTRDRMITHEIMGAGHPRLSFELDTFTWLNPHYQIDDDYVLRKQPWNGLRDWGVGQGVAAANLLDILIDEHTGWQGIFPELVLFDCHACHRPISAGRWGPRPGTGLGPGVVRLNDANLVMFRHVLAAVDPARARELASATRALHQATSISREATLREARRLKGLVDAAVVQVAAYPFAASSLKAILASLVADGEAGELRDYAAGEQAAMAAQSAVVAFESFDLLDGPATERLRALVDAVYATVDDEERYQMAALVQALERLRDAAP